VARIHSRVAESVRSQMVRGFVWTQLLAKDAPRRCPIRWQLGPDEPPDHLVEHWCSSVF
jgi:hypothetical protein